MSKRVKRFGNQIVCALFALLLISSVKAQSIADVAASLVGCALIGEFRASMPVEPLYQSTDGECVAMNPRGSSVSESLSWFEDPACLTRVGFLPTPLAAFCVDIADGTVLGAGENIVPSMWTLTPGSRINVGALSLSGVPQPYLQRISYARFPTSAGICELEMRVYKPHPSAQGLRSMIALHGGAWRFRGLGYFGLELTIPHWVNQGFAVYAPFYRLLDDVDGSIGCQNAELPQIVEDAQAALNWVQENADRYGSSGKPVVFGQSAGAHLAGSLWLNRRDEVSGAVLLYPPTDFTDFVSRVDSGEYTDEEGIDILELILGGTPGGTNNSTETHSTASLIANNSYPQRVAEQPDGLAPLMLLHGRSDTLVEDSQSIRLCNALAGRDISSNVQAAGDGLRTIVGCDPMGSNVAVASSLHLFDEGRHAMDICIEGQVLADETCPSGSDASARAIGESIQAAVNFSQQAFDAALLDGDGGLSDIAPGTNSEMSTDANPSIDIDTNPDAQSVDGTAMSSEGNRSWWGSGSPWGIGMLFVGLFIRRLVITRNNELALH